MKQDGKKISIFKHTNYILVLEKRENVLQTKLPNAIFCTEDECTGAIIMLVQPCLD